MPVRRRVPILLSLALLALGACDTNDGRELPAPGPDQTLTIATTSTVAEALPAEGLPAEDGEGTGDQVVVEDTGPMLVGLPWESGGPIPIDNTCAGADRSPAISWSQLPPGTVEVAVAVTDLTAGEFVHWVVFGLDPTSGGLPEDAASTYGGQAINGFGIATYGGPCPPSGTHTYRFTVYALNQQLETPAGLTAEETLQSIGAATIESVSDTGTFSAS